MPDIDRRSVLAGAGLTVAAVSSAGAQTREPQARRPLEGKVALVTGAARGIGRGCAVELAKDGASVAILDIAEASAMPRLEYPLASAEDMEQTAQRVRAQGVKAITIKADTRDLEAMTQAMERTKRELGSLDAVVANAGINVSDGLDKWDPAIFQMIMSVNLTGTANTVFAAAKALPRPGGRIVIISSVAGRGASGQDSYSYSTSKWAVTGLMKNAAAQLGEAGITVNCVAPSGVATVLYYKGDASPEQRAEKEKEARESSVLPVGVLDIGEIGKAAAFFAGPKADYISGTTLEVAAGRSAKNLG